MELSDKVFETNLRAIAYEMGSESSNQQLIKYCEFGSIDQVIAEMMQTTSKEAVSIIRESFFLYKEDKNSLGIAIKLAKESMEKSTEPANIIKKVAVILKIDYVQEAINSGDYYKARGMFNYMVKRPLKEGKRIRTTNKVLVVSNEDDVRGYVPPVLSDQGFGDISLANSTSALDKLKRLEEERSERYGLIILDLRLSDIAEKIIAAGHINIPFLYVDRGSAGKTDYGGKEVFMLPGPKDSHKKEYKENLAQLVGKIRGEVVLKNNADVI